MKLAVDTNIFGYAAGIGDDDAKRIRAGWLLKSIPPYRLVMPSQVAGELYNLLCRKGGQKPKIATKIVLDWVDALTFAPQGPGTMREALQTASFQNLQIWDALIINTASEAGCSVLLSEDLQNGFICRGVTVVNPFAETLHPLLASVINGMPGPNK
ncbi:PIN domain-containing protein [Brevundimonas sp.]|uniref:PIN domain-containing protein n=1 Tax=Brevundimonas sp. TaxID=1871086 RepID=UPI001A20D2DB|nr:PIN domain-containing protein [Brevundimonas sp.]MBJ7484506.1 PIN domain-containing protein [Brevundimonas sp.]